MRRMLAAQILQCMFEHPQMMPEIHDVMRELYSTCRTATLGDKKCSPPFCFKGIYDRTENFLFDYEPNGIIFGS